MKGRKKCKVFTSGSWDLFHIGHINILERSKALGDELIVGVSTDELIEEYKGMPPIIPFEERFRIIESIKCVDKAVRQTIITEISQLKELEIDIVTIGEDWKEKKVDGLEWMESQSGKVVVYFECTKGVSTSEIKQKIIRSTYSNISADPEHKIKYTEKLKNKQSPGF